VPVFSRTDREREIHSHFCCLTRYAKTKSNKNISRRALGSGFQNGSTGGARKLLSPCTFARSKSSCLEGGGWDLFEGGEAANEAVVEQKLAEEGFRV
jgi:hypothetical protein